METLQALHKRRSIRKYKKEVTLTPTQIETILRAAMSAPTARNMREWEFLVVTAREKLDIIPTVHPYAAMLTTAPCAIIVCGNTSTEMAQQFWPIDCAAAMQNILIAATDLGLGSVWLGVYPRVERVDGIKKLFNMPAHIMPLGIAVIGAADEEPSVVDRFDKSKIKYNSY